MKQTTLVKTTYTKASLPQQHFISKAYVFKELTIEVNKEEQMFSHIHNFYNFFTISFDMFETQRNFFLAKFNQIPSFINKFIFI